MKRLRVLVVDDCTDLAHDWARVIKRWGHDVTVATEGLAALRAAASGIFDAAVLDIDLPGMNGFDLAEALRQQPGHEAILLIAATGRLDIEARQRAAATGFQHYLTKPIAAGELMGVLQADTEVTS
jgi:CheY-like chemotaxis protein